MESNMNGNDNLLPLRGPISPLIVSALLGLSLLLGGCGSDNDQGPLEIIGTYQDEFFGTGFGTIHIITQDTWTQQFETGGTSVFHILEYSNFFEFLTAQNDSANGFNPDLFSRFDWTFFNGNLYYCQIAFDKTTLEDARATKDADRTDPPNSGCGGFFWTNLTP